MDKQDMQLKDLKSGYIIETKGGTLLLVVKVGHSNNDTFTTNVAMSESCWVNLGHYNQDFTRYDFLERSNGKELEEKRDIVAVYEPKRYGVYCTLKEILNKNNLKKIWGFENCKKMTQDDIEKELGCKIEIIENKNEKL